MVPDEGAPFATAFEASILSALPPDYELAQVEAVLVQATETQAFSGVVGGWPLQQPRPRARPARLPGHAGATAGR